jgi:hypothetical protein
MSLPGLPSFPCIAVARRFDATRHLPFMIGDLQVGWIRRSDVDLLARWPEFFEVRAQSVALAAQLDSVESRSAALRQVIDGLAASGRITGWRNEIYAIRNAFDDPPLAFIERAASPFFGTLTYGVNVNGVVPLDQGAAGCDSWMWIARRSAQKQVDPGMLDTLVGGGIAWGHSVPETLLKEAWEESGIATELAGRAVPGRTLHILHEVAAGTHAEQLFIYDLELPADFVPCNQDGEVSEHRLSRPTEVLQWVQDGSMTVYAGLSVLDHWLRREYLHAQDEPALSGMAALFAAPV